MNAEESAETAQPFSLVVAVRSIGDEGLRAEFKASPAERAALAASFELERLDLFEGHYELTPRRNAKFAMDATFDARLVQQCVVSLDSIENELAETFSVEFVPEQSGEPTQVLDLQPDGPPIEFYANGLIDVGAILAQQLSLAIDPYPRKTGAQLDWAGADEQDKSDEPPGPFAALAKLGRNKAD